MGLCLQKSYGILKTYDDILQQSQCVMTSQINWVIKWLQLLSEYRSKAVIFT